MRKTYAASKKVVERLEQKYQKKIRFQKYKSFAKHVRQHLSKAQGTSAQDLEDEALEMHNIRGFEYIR